MSEPCWACNEPVEIDEGVISHEACLNNQDAALANLVRVAEELLPLVQFAQHEIRLRLRAAIEQARMFL